MPATAETHTVAAVVNPCTLCPRSPLPPSKAATTSAAAPRRNQSKGSNANKLVVREAVEPDHAANHCCHKEPDDDAR